MMFLAWRNVARSWSHHGPVAVYFGVALALVMIGQGILAGADHNLRSVYPRALTGDLCVIVDSNPAWTLFGQGDALWGDSSVPPVVPGSGELLADVLHRPGVEAASGLVAGPALVDQSGTHHPVWVFGAEPMSLGLALPGLVPSSPWTSRGAWLSGALNEDLGTPSEVTLLYSSGQDFQMVQAPVVGTAGASSPVAALDHVLWVDVESARHLLGLNTAAPVPVAAGEADLLGSDEAALFGDGPVSEVATPVSVPGESASAGPAVSWNFLVVRLAPGFDPKAVARVWNLAWQSQHRGVKAMEWREAAGGSALYVVWLQGVLAIGVGLLAMVGGGSLVNAMTGVVVERTAEVGTLRALGATRFRVFVLFCVEALLVVAAGFAIAFLVTEATQLLLNLGVWRVQNQLFGTLMGSRGPQMALDGVTLGLDAAVVVALTLGATWLPLRRVLAVDVVRALEQVPE